MSIIALFHQNVMFVKTCAKGLKMKKKIVKVSHSSMFLHEEFLVMYIIEMCRHNILKNKKISVHPSEFDLSAPRMQFQPDKDLKSVI